MGVSKSEAMTKVKSVLVKFGVEHWHDARVESLSAGQKHLVCLMSVVAMAPRIVILDEPFAGLDVPTKMQLERYLAAYDGAVLHISHDPRDINAYEQIIWIDHGAVRDQGGPERILPAYLAEMESLGECNDIAELSS